MLLAEPEQVAQYIEERVSEDSCYVNIKLDEERIRLLKVCGTIAKTNMDCHPWGRYFKISNECHSPYPAGYHGRVCARGADWGTGRQAQDEADPLGMLPWEPMHACISFSA